LERLIPFWADAGLIPDPPSTEILPTLRILVPLVQERLKTLRDVVDLTDFVFQPIQTPEVDELIGRKMNADESLHAIQATQRVLRESLQFDAAAIEPALRDLADKLGVKAGQLFGIIRTAVTGKRVSPPLFGSLQAVGREETLKRLENAEEVLQEHLDSR
jgi:glutamyl-tRNA synthetase